jgi:translation initiation factor IF-2
MDLEGADSAKVKTQLAEEEVVVREFGGDVDTVEISAKTGKGVDELLENVTVLAELLELEADDEAPLEAVVIEAAKDQYKGPVARVIVKQGTLKVRQEIIADGIGGRVKSLTNELGQSLNQVKPGEPAEVLGLNDVPEVGVILKDKQAGYSQEKAEAEPKEEFSWSDVDLESLMGDKEKLNLIVKADVKGTLEAIVNSLDENSIELIRAEVGPLTESDLELAETSDAVVIVFGQPISSKMKRLAQQLEVIVKQYDIIYHLLEDLEEQMHKLMDPHYGEVDLGEAEILKVFDFGDQKVAGIRVKTGEINKHDTLYLKRDDEIIARPVITTMKHGKDEIETVKAKSEAGLSFKNKNLDFKKGDIITAYKKEL